MYFALQKHYTAHLVKLQLYFHTIKFHVLSEDAQ